MQGGTKNQLSINMSNVKRDIRRGCTQWMEPHQYTDVEMERLRNRRDCLQDQQDEMHETRQAARVNSHTTLGIGRAITEAKEAMQEGARDSKALYQAAGGAGSSGDLMVQCQTMLARVRQTKAAEKAVIVATAKATKEADIFFSEEV